MSEQTSLAAPTTAARARQPSADGHAARWLAGVSAGYVLLQAALVVPGTGLGWDESVYTSQVSGSVPAAFFSAPRARGVTFLAAPVAQWTASAGALRVWMALLSGVGLFWALWVWRTLVPVRVLALAGALFATLWISLFYGPQVMPNVWSAYGALAAVGCFLRLARDRADRWAVAGLVAAVAVTGLMRPPDAVWLVLPLAGAALLVPRWRGPLLLTALAAGLLLGCSEWIAEAYARYGGLAERIRLGGRIQGGMGWNIAVDDQLRSLDGRGLCRPCDVPWRHRGTALWWFAVPPLAAAGVVAAARVRRRATAWLPLLTAASCAAPYLFLIGYAAPRFLLPAYALLSVPVAYALWAVAAAPSGRWRPAPAALVAAALCAHVAIQIGVTAHDAQGRRDLRRADAAVADRLHSAGVRPPCVLSGSSAVPLAFHAGCASRQIGGPDASITAAGLTSAAGRVPVAFLVTAHGRPPDFARAWRAVPLPGAGPYAGYLAYVAPRAGGG